MSGLLSGENRRTFPSYRETFSIYLSENFFLVEWRQEVKTDLTRTSAIPHSGHDSLHNHFYLLPLNRCLISVKVLQICFKFISAEIVEMKRSFVLTVCLQCDWILIYFVERFLNFLNLLPKNRTTPCFGSLSLAPRCHCERCEKVFTFFLTLRKTRS